ncbi:triose-phosphate isomerase [Bifidobacterium vespertilionis]|uniref:triose-phosphate isomerase n=1 Tax=Bifidobacterium vespertilionis TaxID=2562524 RepID=UPI001CC32949|nr:triose-phosphate isomerase [Bifidobacterium vespertilionis]
MPARPRRKPLVVGNWKMNLNHREAAQWMIDYSGMNDAWEGRMAASGQPLDRPEIGILPPFTSLQSFIDTLGERGMGKQLVVGAQTVSDIASGAYTGDISADMLSTLGCKYVLVGHSEQRRYHPEDDDTFATKMRVVLDNGMQPILCIGETRAGREHGIGIDYALRQLAEAVSQMDCEDMKRVIVAYEPVWSIGTGNVPDLNVIESALADIRDFINAAFGADIAAAVRILYGGSVKPENAMSIIRLNDIDGFLVGGASLDPCSFAKICHRTAEASVTRHQRPASRGFKRSGRMSIAEFKKPNIPESRRILAADVAREFPDTHSWRLSLALAAYRTAGFSWLEVRAVQDLIEAVDAAGSAIEEDPDMLRDIIWDSRRQIIEAMIALIERDAVQGVYSVNQWLVESDPRLTHDERCERLVQAYASSTCRRAYHYMSHGDIDYDVFCTYFLEGYLSCDANTDNRRWRRRGIDRYKSRPWFPSQQDE